MKLYLEVPYEDSMLAMEHGAYYDKSVHKWYIENDCNSATDLLFQYGKWLKKGISYVTEEIHLLNWEQTCCECGRPTKMIGFGIGTHFVHHETTVMHVGGGKELGCMWLAWPKSEEDIPRLLRAELQERFPSLKDSEPNPCDVGRLSNHCEYCGVRIKSPSTFADEGRLCIKAWSDTVCHPIDYLWIRTAPLTEPIPLSWRVYDKLSLHAVAKYTQYTTSVMSASGYRDFFGEE